MVRTAWLYGAGGPNFVRTMIDPAGTRPTVDVVDDQRGQPTWSADLAAFLVRLARSGLPPGVYHGTSAGETTWHGLATEVQAARRRSRPGAPGARHGLPAPRPGGPPAACWPAPDASRSATSARPSTPPGRALSGPVLSHPVQRSASLRWAGLT